MDNEREVPAARDAWITYFRRLARALALRWLPVKKSEIELRG